LKQPFAVALWFTTLSIIKLLQENAFYENDLNLEKFRQKTNPKTSQSNKRKQTMSEKGYTI